MLRTALRLTSLISFFTYRNQRRAHTSSVPSKAKATGITIKAGPGATTITIPIANKIYPKTITR